MNARAGQGVRPASAAQSGMLAELRPTVRPGVFVYCRWPHGLDVPFHEVVAAIRGDVGLTVVIGEARARRSGLVPLFRCRWISLGPKPALDRVGVTATIAAALAEAGIPCNVMAALDGDQLFIPVRYVTRAMLRVQAIVRAAQALDPGPATLCGAGKPP